ncbi:MAG: hypothetical protein HQK60_14895, partial [Deltaproteobacteria bacterium]|nr:hypothetical protein [Deltaproteobacteria bacterium]
MFGLMKARTCTLNHPSRTDRRLHYCGTCKTLGSIYGTKARLLLNHDAVFLAELLSAISCRVDSHETWCRGIRSFSCLARPGSDDEIAFPLRYAAAATMTMAEWRLSDRVNDSGRLRWRLLQRLYADNFRLASDQLTRCRFPL